MPPHVAGRRLELGLGEAALLLAHALPPHFMYICSLQDAAGTGSGEADYEAFIDVPASFHGAHAASAVSTSSTLTATPAAAALNAADGGGAREETATDAVGTSTAVRGEPAVPLTAAKGKSARASGKDGSSGKSAASTVVAQPAAAALSSRSTPASSSSSSSSSSAKTSGVSLVRSQSSTSSSSSSSSELRSSHATADSAAVPAKDSAEPPSQPDIVRCSAGTFRTAGEAVRARELTGYCRFGEQFAPLCNFPDHWRLFLGYAQLSRRGGLVPLALLRVPIDSGAGSAADAVPKGKRHTGAATASTGHSAAAGSALGSARTLSHHHDAPAPAAVGQKRAADAMEQSESPPVQPAAARRRTDDGKGANEETAEYARPEGAASAAPQEVPTISHRDERAKELGEAPKSGQRAAGNGKRSSSGGEPAHRASSSSSSSSAAAAAVFDESDDGEFDGDGDWAGSDAIAALRLVFGLPVARAAARAVAAAGKQKLASTAETDQKPQAGLVVDSANAASAAGTDATRALPSFAPAVGGSGVKTGGGRSTKTTAGSSTLPLIASAGIAMHADVDGHHVDDDDHAAAVWAGVPPMALDLEVRRPLGPDDGGPKTKVSRSKGLPAGAGSSSSDAAVQGGRSAAAAAGGGSPASAAADGREDYAGICRVNVSCSFARVYIIRWCDDGRSCARAPTCLPCSRTLFPGPSRFIVIVPRCQCPLLHAPQPGGWSSGGSSSPAGQWEAYAFVAGARISAGVFPSAATAARAHDRLLMKIHGLRAALPLLNFPDAVTAEWAAAKLEAAAESAEREMRE